MNQVPGVASGSRITTGGTSSPSVWVEINTRKRAREPTEDDREERDKKRRHGDGDDMETDDEITEPGKFLRFFEAAFGANRCCQI